jgi:DNA-binding response OmpR family regulator
MHECLSGEEKMEKSKVLIIDDEELMRSTTKLLLTHHGRFQVECAHNGQRGIEMVKSVKPDLILLDIMMPDLDGWEVLKLLKENAETACIPVVIFTAIDGDISDRQLSEYGAVGLIRKPFHLQELLAVISKILSGGTDGQTA